MFANAKTNEFTKHKKYTSRKQWRNSYIKEWWMKRKKKEAKLILCTSLKKNKFARITSVETQKEKGCDVYFEG